MAKKHVSTHPSHGAADMLVGLRHFLFDRVPRGLDIVPPKPRKGSPYRKDGVALVSKVEAGQDLRASVVKAVELLGGLNRVI